MSDYSTKELQNEILKLLRKIHKICLENNIKYTLHGGSLLGAVREKGFIPWDDDGDIALFRSEYEKLKNVMLQISTENFYLDYERDKVKKIWLKQDGKPTVWVDIFIYDYISEKKIDRKLKIDGLKFLAACSKNKTSMAQFRTNQRAKGVQRITFEFIYLLSRPFPLKSRIKMIDHYCEKRHIGNKQYVHRANDQLWAMPMVLSVDRMMHYQTVPFEDTELMISTNYDEILTQLYGKDYMTPRRASDSETEVHNLSRENG